MWISQGTVEGFLHAFHAKQTDSDFAMIVLTVKQEDLSVVDSLVRGRAELDLALGKRVGLFLFGNTDQRIVHASSARIYAMKGACLDEAKLTPAREFFSDLSTNRDVSPAQRRELIAETTLEIVPDFCAALDIDVDALPCMCVLIRGSREVIVVPIRQELSFKGLAQAASAVRAEVQAFEARLDLSARVGPRAREWLAAAEAMSSKRDEMGALILSKIQGLERRFNIVLTPQVRAMLVNGDVAIEKIGEIVKDQAPDKMHEASQSGRWRGLSGQIDAWRKYHASLDEMLKGMSLAEEMKRQDYLIGFEGDLSKAIVVALEGSGLSVKRYRDFRPRASGIKSAIDIVGGVVNLLKKVSFV